MATTRKSIPKRIRFEVFKRDKFTCQYCGRMAPDVILEVDHIKPVSKGGTNDILNLVTSCRDCNSGKTNRELSDDSVIKKQQAQLTELATKSEQLEMLLKWRDSMSDIKHKQIDAIMSYMAKRVDLTLCENIEPYIRRLIRKYNIDEILDAIDIFSEKYDVDSDNPRRMMSLIDGICSNSRKKDNKAYYFNYLRKVCRDKFREFDSKDIHYLVDTFMHNDDDFAIAKSIIISSSRYDDFCSDCKAFFLGAKHESDQQDC